jgi:uncharacterized protein YggU (UPF0235/DUF167 family)
MLAVRVSPKAAREGIDGLVDTAEGPAVKVRVRAVPADGEANAAVETVVAEWLGLPASRVAVARGHKSRVKMLEIVGDVGALEVLVTGRVSSLG